MDKFNRLSSDCTAIIVGKKASIDGSTIIARDEDAHTAINTKKFVVVPSQDYDLTYESKYTGLKVPVKGHGYRYTATPNGNPSEGDWFEAGINEQNVAMSATETELTNPRVLGHDPLVENGIAEDAMVTLVLPFVNSAREGVQRLGSLIEKYGTAETNGIAFSDQNEVWYMETAGGHQWVAQRLPDDAYAICPNIMVIENIEFDDKDNFMYAAGIRDFVEKYHLNPNPLDFNFRNIFGSQNEADSYYNTPRTWYGQRLFNPSVEQEPTSQNMPFCRKPEKKIAIEDVQFFLSSHYNGTQYDPFGTHSSGNEDDQQKFRSIALDRNQSSCILQLRNDVPANMAAIQWIAFGFYCYSPYVPFYANIVDTPANYKFAPDKFNLDSAYWMYKLLPVIIEPKYHQFINQVNAYRDDAQSYVVGRLDEVDEQAKNLSGDELQEFLTNENIKTTDHVTEKTTDLIDQLIHQTLLSSKIAFNLGDGL